MINENRLAIVRAHNNLQLIIGGNNFLKTIFDGPDGWYYDAIGDEILMMVAKARGGR